MEIWKRVKGALLLLYGVLFSCYIRADSVVVTQGDFMSLDSYFYAKNKEIVCGGDKWLVSSSQLTQYDHVFYLGCNASNTSKGLLDNSIWGDVVTALKKETSFSVTKDHAYVMKLMPGDNPLENVDGITFNWSNSNSEQMTVFLFGDSGEGLYLLKKTVAAQKVAGKIECTFSRPLTLTNLVLLALPSEKKDKTICMTTYEITAKEQTDVVPKPVASLQGGIYHATQQVTLLTSVPDAEIRYTLDGTEPGAESGWIYVSESPIVIDKTTTLKAVAVKDGVCSEVVTETYQIELPETVYSIADFKSLEKETWGKLVWNEAVVTGVNESEIYIQDKTGGIILWNSGKDYQEGDIPEGSLIGINAVMDELPVVKNSDCTFMTVSAGGDLSSPVITLEELEKNKARYTCCLVQLEGVKYEDSSAGKYLVQKEHRILFEDRFDVTGQYTMNWPAESDVTGIVIQRQGEMAFCIRSTDDVVNISGLEVPVLKWDKTACEVDLGDTGWSAPVLTNTSDGVLTYTSSDHRVATISNEGYVTLVGAGTTTIKVSVAESISCSAASAEYELTVTDASAGDLRPVAFVADFRNGNYALSAQSSSISGALAAVPVYKVGGKAVVTEHLSSVSWYQDHSAQTITSSDGRYLFAEETETSLSLSTKKCTWEWDAERNCWKKGERSFLFVSDGQGNSCFKNYSLSNMGTGLYGESFSLPMQVAEGYVRAVKVGNLGTVCLPGTVLPGDFKGAVFRMIIGKTVDAGNQPASIVLSAPVTELLAGVPYVFTATEDKIVLAYTGQRAAKASSMNGLTGTFEGINTDKDVQDVQLQDMYLFSGSVLQKSGKGSSLAACRAYVDMSKVPVWSAEASVNQFKINIKGGTDALLRTVSPDEELVDVYGWDGIKIRSRVLSDEATRELPSGIYIVNGKKINIR